MADTSAPHSETAEEPEVQKCHLHRKASKACKFCKAYAGWVERQTKKREEARTAEQKQLKGGSSSGQRLSAADKSPVPNFESFPRVFAQKIWKAETYYKIRNTEKVTELIEILSQCDSCDTEVVHKFSLYTYPSPFICVVYRLLEVLITEGDLLWMMKNDSVWIRCAACLYVRLGFHCDRYWECLGPHLMDDEEFTPFTGKGAEGAMTVAQYVEDLLVKQDYGHGETESKASWSGSATNSGAYTKMALPRVPLAAKTKISKRMCLIPQFRMRYRENLDVMDRFLDYGTDVEVCNADGEWQRAKTSANEDGKVLLEERCPRVLVVYPSGAEEYVSIGRLIVPSFSSSSSTSDLTCNRGKSAKDLIEKYDEEMKGNAVARGKDYARSQVVKVCVGGVRFLAGDKRSRDERVQQETEEEKREQEEVRAKRQQQANAEQLAKMAAIESKYCARVPSHDSFPQAPDRVRLG